SRHLRCKPEGFSGVVGCVLWPDDFPRHKDEVREDRVCLVRGTVERTREEPGLVLTRILGLEQAQQEMATGLWLLMRLGREPADIDRLALVLRRSPGHCPVYLTIRDGASKTALLRLGRDFAVNPSAYDHD